MVLFTHNIKKIKFTADKNGDFDDQCEHPFNPQIESQPGNDIINIRILNHFILGLTLREGKSQILDSLSMIMSSLRSSYCNFGQPFYH